MPARKKTPSKSVKSIPFEARVRKFKGSSMHYLHVPDSVFKRLGGKYMVRLIAEIPKHKMKFHCGLLPVGDGTACIFFSKARVKETGLREGHSVKAIVKLDVSRYGMKLPVELSEILKQDTDARRRFNRLSPGKQRNIIFHVASTKDDEKRLDRAVQIMRDLLMMPEGKEIMHVLMNPTLKENFEFTTPAEEAAFRARFHPVKRPPTRRSGNSSLRSGRKA